MTWKTLVYGVEQPSKIKVNVHNLFFCVFALWVYVLFVDFVPSEAWSKFGLYLSITLSAIAFAVYFWAFSTGRMPIRAGSSTFIKIVVCLFLPGMFFILLWVPITHGIADIATRALGNDKILTAQLSKYQRHSLRGCEFRLKGEYIEKAVPNYICLTESQFESLPSVGIYTLQTKETILGFHIISLNIADAR